jgi:hypothetical protein
MIAVYRRVPLHFGRLFRVRVVMGRHDDTDYGWEIWKERERKRMKIEQNTKLDDSAKICPRESRGFPER